MEIVTRVIANRLDKVRYVGEGSNEIIRIKDALKRADDLGLDLVLVSDEVTPPVVRVQDFKKLEYEKKKAKKASRSTVSVLKEIQFKVNISDHDLQTKINKINEFLDRGDKVKIQVRLKGRERDNPERGTELIDRVIAGVDCKASRVPGPIATALLEPSKIKPAAKSSK